MNLSILSNKYNTQDKCIEHLEKIRWAGEPWCPHCDSDSVKPRKRRKHYYHCNTCNKDFTVLFGTIFEGSKLPLPKWFQLISLMLNAKGGISSKQIQRTLGITYKSAWYSAMRVRCAMVDDFELLEGIVEMDEAYVGGKPRHRNTATQTAAYSKLMTKPGKGTKNIPVVGIVERKYKKRVRFEIENKLTTKNLLALLKKYVALNDDTIIMTDELPAYKAFNKYVKHLVVNHSKKEYAKDSPFGKIHTNTIEGVWSIIKNGIKGQYKVLSRKYLPFYLAEFAYKYNRKQISGKEVMFDETIDSAVQGEKCLVDYKPKGNVDEIVYGKKAGQACATKSATPKSIAAKRIARSKPVTIVRKGKKITTPRHKKKRKDVPIMEIPLAAKHKKLISKGLMKKSKMNKVIKEAAAKVKPVKLKPTKINPKKKIVKSKTKKK